MLAAPFVDVMLLIPYFMAREYTSLQDLLLGYTSGNFANHLTYTA